MYPRRPEQDSARDSNIGQGRPAAMQQLIDSHTVLASNNSQQAMGDFVQAVVAFIGHHPNPATTSQQTATRNAQQDAVNATTTAAEAAAMATGEDLTASGAAAAGDDLPAEDNDDIQSLDESLRSLDTDPSEIETDSPPPSPSAERRGGRPTSLAALGEKKSTTL